MLSKFAVAIVVIPLVALRRDTWSTQLADRDGGVVEVRDRRRAGGIPVGAEGARSAAWSVAALWCMTAMIWYAPFVGYLMLASAWAPRSPFLWAVLPPVSL